MEISQKNEKKRVFFRKQRILKVKTPPLDEKDRIGVG